MELFNKDLKIKELQRTTRYDDLENVLLNLKGKVELKEISESSHLHKKIYAVEKGNKNGKKILITSANHGEEEAGPLAALQIIKEMANPSRNLEAILKEARLIVIPCIDPDGFDLKARKFVDAAGNAELWPTDRGRGWEDINGTWNREYNLPDQVRKIRDYIDSFKLDLAFDLHETIPSFNEKEHVYKDYGMLVIEAQKYGYEDVGEAIIENLKINHFGVFQSKLFNMASGMSPVPQTKPKGEGRAYNGPLLTEFTKAIMVLDDYIARKNGIQAYTFETFLASLENRIGAHLAGVEGGISNFLNKPLNYKLPIKEELIKIEKKDGKKEDFYLACDRIAQEKLGNHGIRIYKANRIKPFQFPKEIVYAWSREGKGQLEFKRKMGKIHVVYLENSLDLLDQPSEENLAKLNEGYKKLKKKRFSFCQEQYIGDVSG